MVIDRCGPWPPVSTVSSTMVNELRIGYKLTKQFSWNPFYVGRADETCGGRVRWFGTSGSRLL